MERHPISMGWNIAKWLNIVKMAVEQSTDSTQSLSKSCSAKIDKVILNFIRKCTKTVSKEKNKVRGLTLPNFKTCYKGTVIRTMWCRHTDSA